MKKIIEIRAAEGGEDSKLFVKDLAKAYQKLAYRLGWLINLNEDYPGYISLTISGSLEHLQQEAGGHRIQRIPPTEKRGRVHTSTVTVAILDQYSKTKVQIDKKDLEVSWFSGTGPGGQNRNKVQASCRLTHIPSGITATAQTRSRSNSYEQAFETLQKRINENSYRNHETQLRSLIQNQVGSGQRGDKIRTVQFQHNIATDHRTGKKITAEQYMRGYMDLFWPNS